GDVGVELGRPHLDQRELGGDEEALAAGRYAPPLILFQPVWKFTATAENGDELIFYVQAVEAGFVQN
ncbi:MAG: hypothetical protein L0322_29790, partial [Chloroflexi bacterium]|nr:hypothetical protein [Chloroflexota bacterium]